MRTSPHPLSVPHLSRSLAAVATLGLWACSSSSPPPTTDAGPDAGGGECSIDANCAGGLICDLASGTGVCRLPNEFEACQPDAGCASSSAVCAALPLLGQACAFPCQMTSACPDPITSCRDVPGTTTQLCLPTPCTDGGLYTPCTVDAPNDGLCIPGGIFGNTCLAGGTVPQDGGCSLARTPAGAGDRCVPGDACTVCFALCGSAGDAGLPCTGGTSCVSFTGGPVAGFASYGYCAETCSPGSNASCPTGFSCIDYVNPPVCWP
jgi:hypothetical protein